MDKLCNEPRVPFEEIFRDESGLLAKHPTWERVLLKDVVTIINGFPFNSKYFSKAPGFPLIRIRDLASNKTATYYTGEYGDNQKVKNGDLVIGMDGNFACYEWKGVEGLLNQRVCRIIPNENFLIKGFLLYGINGYLAAIQNATSSVTVGHLSSLDILKIPFHCLLLTNSAALSPSWMNCGKVDACKARLDKILAILKRFRHRFLPPAPAALTADCASKWQRRRFEHTTIETVADYIGGFAYKSQKFLKWENIRSCALVM
jgi:hypothetical protein